MTMAKPLSKQWDSLFRKYRGRLPVPFLRALSKRESNMNPNESDWPAYGLMQIVPTVRKSWNKRTGDNWTHQDLLDPTLNVRMATSLLNRIVKAFGRHPDPNMKENWGNPEFVNLVTAGWNSGYSEAAGVGKVAKYLEARGLPVTHDNIFQYASRAGGTKHLKGETAHGAKKQRWQKTVTALYFQQPDALAPGESPVGDFLVKAALAAGAGYLLYQYVFK